MKFTEYKKSSIEWLRQAFGKVNDFYLGIETGDCSLIASAGKDSKYNDGVQYQAADYRNIRRVVRIINPGPDDLVYDIGCGKGRAVCLFACLPLRGVVGIDLDSALCDVARTNATRLRGRCSPIEIRCEDAAVADLSHGTIYFMYNPFGAETLRTVIDRIQESLAKNPRMLRIVYYNPVFEEQLLARPWLHRETEFKTLTGRRVTFWSNRYA